MENSVISVFDTAIAAYNIGNQIIMDAVKTELEDLFPQSFVLSLPVEDIKTNVRHYNTMSDITFVGGTNILNCDIRKYRQWDLSLHNILILSDIVLMGCGWFQYEEQPITRYTQWAFDRIFSKKYIHSVRDEYTRAKLATIGIESINTGCPTLWHLTDEVIAQIPKEKKKSVVITLTDYNRNRERDEKLLEICLRNYEVVYLFPQGTGDIPYVTELGYIDRLQFVSPQIHAYNAILESGDVDYIGTRLHAGIRALQKSVRSFIIGIDNRAKEMSRDFGILVLDETRIDELDAGINAPYDISLNIPFERIETWKQQFRK